MGYVGSGFRYDRLAAHRDVSPVPAITVIRRIRMIRWFFAIPVFLLVLLTPVHSQQNNSPNTHDQSLEQPMSLERMEEILLALSPDMESDGTRFLLIVEDVRVFVITDVDSDRMRVMTPIRPYQNISPEEMKRMMQANFDSALDARYAIARDMLWSVYIHPLSPLQKNQLISGIGQVVNLARTYGTAYSGGGLSFGGGDSDDINKRLIEELLEKGEEV